MLLAIRLLTLVTFTVHAVLGCCLMHGGCMHEQVSTVDNHCCDHDDHDCGLNEPKEDQNHEDHENEFELSFAGKHVASRVKNQDHSTHCDNETCIFGLGSPTTASELKVCSDTGLHYPYVAFSITTSRNANNSVNSLRGPPCGTVLRAFLQIWII